MEFNRKWRQGMRGRQSGSNTNYTEHTISPKWWIHRFKHSRKHTTWVSPNRQVPTTVCLFWPISTTKDWEQANMCLKCQKVDRIVNNHKRWSCQASSYPSDGEMFSLELKSLSVLHHQISSWPLTPKTFVGGEEEFIEEIPKFLFASGDRTEQ